MANQKDFDKVLKKLKDSKKVKGKLQLTECGEIQALLGRNYPDELCDDIWDICEAEGVQVEVMADANGYVIMAKSFF